MNLHIPLRQVGTTCCGWRQGVVARWDHHRAMGTRKRQPGLSLDEFTDLFGTQVPVRCCPARKTIVMGSSVPNVERQNHIRGVVSYGIRQVWMWHLWQQETGKHETRDEHFLVYLHMKYANWKAQLPRTYHRSPARKHIAGATFLRSTSGSIARFMHLVMDPSSMPVCWVLSWGLGIP